MAFVSVSRQVAVQIVFYENDFDFHQNKRAVESANSRFGTKAKTGNSEFTLLANDLFGNVLLDTSRTRR